MDFIPPVAFRNQGLEVLAGDLLPVHDEGSSHPVSGKFYQDLSRQASAEIKELIRKVFPADQQVADTVFSASRQQPEDSFLISYSILSGEPVITTGLCLDELSH